MPPVKIWAKLESRTRPEWVIEFPTYRPKAAPITIGRNPSCTLCLCDNLTISNRHVLLEVKDLASGKRSVVMHESSSNGTEVDGKLYSKGAKVPLAHGSQVVFPIEEGTHSKSDFTFVFTEFKEEDGGGDGDGEDESPQALLVQELHAIQLQCDALAIEASRLCARTLKPSTSPLETMAVDMLRALQAAQHRLAALGEDVELDQTDEWQAKLRALGIM